MNNKKKKIIAIVVPVVLILLIVLAIVIVVVLPKNDNSDNNACVHSRVYSDYNDEQHKITCSKCTEYIEYQNHSYENDQATKCSLCEHTRVVETIKPEEPKYPYTTPSGVKIAVDKQNLTAGDIFTLTVEIQANMPGYIWHSVSFTICALDSNNKLDTDINSNFEFLSMSTNLDENYYMVRKTSNFANPDPLKCGAFVSFNNLFGAGKADYADKTSATEKIVLTFQIKVKDDATDIPTFNFGAMSIKGNYVNVVKPGTMEKVSCLFNNADKVTKNSIPLTISAK